MRSASLTPARGAGAKKIPLLLPFVLAALPGCVNSESWVFKPQPASLSGISTITMIWSGLAVTRDSANDGKTLPGFAGRLYLMGPDLATPLLREGKVVVDMSVPGPDGKFTLIERWEIDPKTMQRLARKDWVGDGYTLFLPWPAYSPDIAQAQMRAVFYPRNGGPIYGDPTTINIHPPTHIPIEHPAMPTALPTPKLK